MALLLISPLELQAGRRQRPGDAGYLWQVSKHLPDRAGPSLLFWAAGPARRCSRLAVLVRRAGWTSLPSVYLACFLVVALPVALVYQKYFDPFALLAVALFARPPDFRERCGLRRRGGRCAPASVAYALSFAG